MAGALPGEASSIGLAVLQSGSPQGHALLRGDGAVAAAHIGGGALPCRAAMRAALAGVRGAAGAPPLLAALALADAASGVPVRRGGAARSGLLLQAVQQLARLVPLRIALGIPLPAAHPPGPHRPVHHLAQLLQPAVRVAETCVPTQEPAPTRRLQSTEHNNEARILECIFKHSQCCEFHTSSLAAPAVLRADWGERRFVGDSTTGRRHTHLAVFLFATWQALM